jgi:hypothetical protein
MQLWQLLLLDQNSEAMCRPGLLLASSRTSDVGVKSRSTATCTTKFVRFLSDRGT